MLTRRRRSRAASALFAVLACAASSQAANLSIDPTRVHLDPGRGIETLHLGNAEDHPVSFEVRALRWTQRADGSWEQVPTQDLIVQPLILTVPAQGEARLRVGILTPGTPSEQAYRIELQELPGDTGGSGAHVTLLTKVSLPVFVRVAHPAPAPSLQAVTAATGQVHWTLANPGNSYLPPQTGTLRVLDSNGRVLHESAVEVGYVLAGAQLSLSQTLPAAACARAATIRLQLEEPATTLVAPLPAGSRQCGS